MEFPQALRRHRGWWLAGGLVTLLATGLVIAVLAGLFNSDAEQETAAPEPRPTVHVTAPPVEEKPAVDIDSTRFMEYTPVWNPPDGGQDFWQVVDPANGYPADGGTDYVLAHACLDRECAGNLIRTLEDGDGLTYRGEPYLVQEKREIGKTEIADQDIWHHDADRLVVITCIIDPETGIATENDIIIATRAG